MSKSNDEDDPIDELEIGESVEVETSSSYSFWGTTDSDDFCGFDREVSNLTLDDAQLVGDEGNEEVMLSFSGEVTKVEEPEEVVERRETNVLQRHPTAAKLVMTVVAFALFMGVMMVIT